MNTDALGKLNMGIMRILSRYPVLGELLATWKIREDPTVQTMGVSWRETAVELVYAPKFVLSISLDELVAVLHHEVRHVIYGHIFEDPKDYPDRGALIVAEEVTVNENLPGKLPGRPILLKDYKKILKPDTDTMERYEKLAKDASKRTKADPQPTDNHDLWGDFQADKDLAKATIRQSLLDQIEKAPGISDEEKQILEQLNGNGSGTFSGVLTESIQNLQQPSAVNWKLVLRRFVGRECQRDVSYAHPSRRMPHLLGVVPGSRARPQKLTLLAVIDSSGSMTSKDLALIANELKHLGTLVDITIVECDEVIQRVYKFKGQIEDLKGRGGTDLRPPFNRVFLRKTHADLLIYFTDGDGPAPNRKPQIPVLWALTSGGERPAPWGWVTQLPPSGG